jgi:hypothetical protein
MRVCICGGRNYFNAEKVNEVLDYAYQRKPFVLISGGATGADTLGIQWARSREVPVEVYPAQWRLYGRRAGPLRNLKMIGTGIDVLLAFPGGRGTQHMMLACMKHGIKVIAIKDDKKYSEETESPAP